MSQINEVDTTIADTIRAQLGRGTFMMLGAHTFIALRDGLKFKIKGCRSINTILINLNGSDTYDVSFWDVRGINSVPQGTYRDVYVSELHELIRRVTGLETIHPIIRPVF